MDFKAEARQAAKLGGLEDNDAFVAMLATAIEFGVVKGRDSMKKECARKAKNYCTANPDTARLFDSGMAVASKEIAEEIEKL